MVDEKSMKETITNMTLYIISSMASTLKKYVYSSKCVDEQKLHNVFCGVHSCLQRFCDDEKTCNCNKHPSCIIMSLLVEGWDQLPPQSTDT